MPQANPISFTQDKLPIPPQKAEEIVSYFSEIKVAKNDFLLKEGKLCDRYVFLQSGFMRAFTYDTEGNEVTTGFYSANQLVFETMWF